MLVRLGGPHPGKSLIDGGLEFRVEFKRLLVAADRRGCVATSPEHLAQHELDSARLRIHLRVQLENAKGVGDVGELSCPRE